LFPSRIVWNEVVFDSFQAGFLRNIDFQLCIRLEHPTALRMYRFLGKRFYLKPDWTFDLKEFAYEHIGLGRNYEGGTQIARKLQPAIAELEEVGFLAPLAENDRFQKNGRDWSIRFVQKAPALEPPALAPLAIPEETPPLVAELVLRGVTKAKARELVGQYPTGRIGEKLDVFDWLLAKQDKRLQKSPAGYLVKSIEDDYAAPKGFVSRADRQKREEARREAERRAAEERSRRQEEEDRLRAEREAIDAYWNALTPRQQAELDAASRAEAGPEALALEAGPLHRYWAQIRRQECIRRILQSREIPAAGIADDLPA
jgi:hypothetical protein